MDHGLALGFHTMTSEVANHRLVVDGTIPAWVNGLLFRNGPAVFEIGTTPMLHWFDGIGMVNRFAFEDGAVHYTNRIIQSEDDRDSLAAGRPLFNEFVTVPERTFLEKLKASLDPSTLFGDNALIDFSAIDGQLVAQTEAPGGMVVDPTTAAAHQAFAYDDDVSGLISTAHPRYDFRRRVQYNFNIAIDVLAGGFAYVPYGIADGSRTRVPFDKVGTTHIGYQHSLGTSGKYVFLMEFPLRADLLSIGTMAFASRPYASSYSWDGGQTRLIVWDKDTGKHVGTYETDPIFAFHHINAYDDGDSLVLDIAAYADDAIVEATYLGPLRMPGGHKLPFSWFRRYTVNTSSGLVTYADVAADHMYEMPRYHLGCQDAPYRYAYGVSFPKGSELAFPDRLVKIDVETGDAAVWHDPAGYPSEPMFVPRPGGSAEDDGVLMTVLLVPKTGTSELVVLDAASMDVLGRAALPHPIPFGLHGQWFPKGEIAWAVG